LPIRERFTSVRRARSDALHLHIPKETKRMKRPYMRIASWMIFGSVVAFGIYPAESQADDKATDCKIVYTRTACPGQEAESYKKCDGQKSCAKFVAAATEQECQVAAVAACANDRLTITQSKVITATFKGKALKTKAGKDDMCLDYSKRDTEFNQCTKK
jgi:hypothetical protein